VHDLQTNRLHPRGRRERLPVEPVPYEIPRGSRVIARLTARDISQGCLEPIVCVPGRTPDSVVSLFHLRQRIQGIRLPNNRVLWPVPPAMTLILAAITRESIWMLADRRLSIAGRRPKDYACKIMILETTDGVALLGYAGLGATVLGTQPADWMSNVLRGINLPVEQSLGILAAAAKKRLPTHMVHMPGKDVSHNIIVPALLGTRNRLFSIDLAISPSRRRGAWRFVNYNLEHGTDKTPVTPRLALGGTGRAYLHGKRHWIRQLSRLLRASDRLAVSPSFVADHLAKLNHEVI
jgi:hypothetical protein